MGSPDLRLVLEYRAPPKMRFLSDLIYPDPRVDKIRIGAIDSCRILPMVGKMKFVAEPSLKILLEDGGLCLDGAGLRRRTRPGHPGVFIIFCQCQGARGLIIQVTIQDIRVERLPVAGL